MSLMTHLFRLNLIYLKIRLIQNFLMNHLILRIRLFRYYHSPHLPQPQKQPRWPQQHRATATPA